LGYNIRMKNKNILIGILGVVILAVLVALGVSKEDDNLKGQNNAEEVTEFNEVEVEVSQNNEVVATTTLETVSVEDAETEVIPTAPVAAPAPKPASQPAVVTTPKPATPEPAPVLPSGITMAEVRTHADATSCWSAINGSVYDLTTYIPKHPGGKGEILAICGKDGSSAFDGQHGGDSKPERILASYKIDVLSN
jgi:cytochrome b involved in lipid metabolism